MTSPTFTTLPEQHPLAAAAVRLTEVSKSYRQGRSVLQALDGISLTAGAGEFVCIVGASGCGKSTLLSLVAGLDQASSGEVFSGKRRPALMFQEPALFPWLTAARNVELPLRARGVPKRQRRERVAELLHTVRLGEFADVRPHQLSGGMRQRVALARALAQDADVLLMDEPFGALDAITRDHLHTELERVVAECGLTVLFVTHNVSEAVRLGDRVVLLSSRPGRVIAEVPVPVERPRRSNTTDVAALAAVITEKLQVAEAGNGQH
ncbi:ABC transporter ATP-binding protein [Mycolicibacterium sphagni]|uniref:Sulfate ABC transporter ATP-binding protein n=1 Tax=Mycolicibacterium sphagni TaxID=1786 RepID=A0A255DCD4_9MYCO|nr:ABC transporter ATP-binding protein [Mycolicibacterium sphagni]MCV7177461.1 ABC transporter ATP-binding protein [Mycolicibacterium sphagni]OYN77129.1 sulfate ABC transporter ATP-binding protein [Mycolicibacterium sphagni]